MSDSDVEEATEHLEGLSDDDDVDVLLCVDDSEDEDAIDEAEFIKSSKCVINSCWEN